MHHVLDWKRNTLTETSLTLTKTLNSQLLQFELHSRKLCLYWAATSMWISVRDSESEVGHVHTIPLWKIIVKVKRWLMCPSLVLTPVAECDFEMFYCCICICLPVGFFFLLTDEMPFFFPNSQRKSEKKNSRVKWFPVAAVSEYFVPTRHSVEKSASKRAIHAKPQGTASIHSLEIKSWHGKHCNGNNIVSHTGGRKNTNPSETQLGVSCQRGASWD